MAVYKYTFFFEQRSQGWTESYFRVDTLTDLEQGFAIGNALAMARIKLSGDDTRMKWMRISEDQVKGDAFLKALNYLGQAGQDSDSPTTALLVRCSSATRRNRKHVFLRGVWDSVVREGGDFQVSTQQIPDTFTALFNAYKARLITDLWGWNASNLLPVTRLINLVAQNANQKVVVGLEPPAFPAPAVGAAPTPGQVGSIIRGRFSSVDGTCALNGPQVVRITGVNEVTTEKRICFLPWMGSGRFVTPVTVFEQIKFVEPMRIVERRVGRPSFLLRGRFRGRCQR